MTSTAKPRHIPPSSKTLSPPSLRPLPRSLRQNRSFVQLARLIGLTGPDNRDGSDDSGSDAGEDSPSTPGPSKHEDDEDAEANSDVDEESLMWDAQTALISHQPALAAKYYATAALPPHCSSPACLALGNLLARGSGLQQPESQDDNGTEPSSRKSSLVPESGPMSPQSPPQNSWFASFFSSASPIVQSPTVEEKPPPRLTSNGWHMPTDGKRAVRDVDGMGKAGGWLILGIGWILQHEGSRALTTPRHQTKVPVPARDDDYNDDDDDAIVFDSKNKGKARARSPMPVEPTQRIPPSNTSSATDDSFEIHTPEEDEQELSPDKKIKLLYDLLSPLVNLYRHGHIQQHDPVALPPVKASELPSALKPQGDKEKGRNVWALGSIVATKVLELPLLATPNLNKDAFMKRNGVIIMARYIRGITSSPEIAEAEFKAILRVGPCGIELLDELIRQAFRRLNIVLKMTGGTPLDPPEMESSCYLLSHRNRPLNRKMSNQSLFSLADSTMSSSLRLMTPVKSTASLASLSCDHSQIDPFSMSREPTPRQVVAPQTLRAVRSLRSVQHHQDKLQRAQAPRSTSSNGPWWPSLHGWTMTPVTSTVSPVARSRTPAPAGSLSTEAKHEAKPLRSVVSSPHLNANNMPPPPPCRALPFEPTEQIARIDPELAALELASALTKHVDCSVCGASGVNFPNCRKCGLTFCSRKCRVDETGAGNGKRHICGALESRKLLPIPEVRPIAPRGVLSTGTPVAPVPKVC